MSRPRRPALGRGLGALLPATPASADPPASDQSERAAHDDRADRPRSPRTLPIERLEPNAKQPRKHFDKARLEELAASVALHGLIQPIVVVPLPGGDRYQILAGERRWRAAQLAGLHDVPVVVRDTPEEARLEIALVENLQRADLDPIEEARAFAQLIDLRGLTQEQVATRVGKDRSTVANAIRLLRLPDKVQQLVIGGQISMGHARALLSLESAADMTELAHEVIRRRLSVRATEAEVRRRLKGDAPAPELSDELRRHRIIVADLEEQLRRRLGVMVRLKTGDNPKGPGRIELPYGNLDELNRLLERLLESDG